MIDILAQGIAFNNDRREQEILEENEAEIQQDREDIYIRYPKITNEFNNPIYDKVYQRSIIEKESFWKEQAKDLIWTKYFNRVLDKSDKYMQRWYPDGEMNICYNCIDRHVDEGRGDKIAFQYESVYTGIKESISYVNLLERVGKLSSLMQQKFDIQKDDRVLIYMPMVPPAAFSMLACARIGAIHSVVFGGFAAKELANRIDDCKPKLIITCSFGIEPNKVIAYLPIVEEALSLC